MSKPIFIIRFPFTSSRDKELFEEQYDGLVNKLYDYHVLALLDTSVRKVEFECYNSPHTEIEFEQLKNQILDTLKKA